jgi:hypothetical protein
MDLMKPYRIARKAVKNIVGKVQQTVEEAAKDVEQEQKLEKWKKKFETAHAAYAGQISLMDEREYLYLGTRGVDGNINSKQLPTKYANNVNNIIFELIESEVDTTIPQPSVKSKRPEFSLQANMIEDSITSDLTELGIEEINDYNERITPVQGFSLIEVCWDPDFKHQLYRGEIKLDARHPKQLIPQPGVFKLQRMDYLFLLYTVTKEYVKRRTGKDLEQEEESNTENTRLYGNPNQNNTDSETVTEIVCYYKDEEGDICKFSWVNDVVIEDLPKLFYRRYKRCADCNAMVQPDADTCENCGSDKLKDATEAVTVLDMDTRIGTGELLPAGTEVPAFVPTRYPIIVRKNVPKNFAFEGQSDVDVIRDQQDSIKKSVTKMEEKMIRGGSLIFIPEDLNVEINDSTYQVVRGTAAQLSQIKVEDLTADISKDLTFVENQYQIAKSMLGITDAFQGKEDPTAKSGVAKQIQVQQASGRMQSKAFNKHAAFRELFEIMFEFKLAFYDEVRPYLAKDKDGKDMFQEFDKYAFLIRDASGQLYYNTDFVFSADAGQGLPKDKLFQFNQANQMLQSGAMDKLQYWTIMEALNYPMAKQIKGQIEQEMQQQQAMEQAAAEQQQAMAAQQPQGHPFDDALSQAPAHVQQMFKKLPPEAQQQIMNTAMPGAS